MGHNRESRSRHKYTNIHNQLIFSINGNLMEKRQYFPQVVLAQLASHMPKETEGGRGRDGGVEGERQTGRQTDRERNLTYTLNHA